MPMQRFHQCLLREPPRYQHPAAQNDIVRIKNINLRRDDHGDIINKLPDTGILAVARQDLIYRFPRISLFTQARDISAGCIIFIAPRISTATGFPPAHHRHMAQLTGHAIFPVKESPVNLYHIPDSGAEITANPDPGAR